MLFSASLSSSDSVRPHPAILDMYILSWMCISKLETKARNQSNHKLFEVILQITEYCKLTGKKYFGVLIEKEKKIKTLCLYKKFLKLIFWFYTVTPKLKTKYDKRLFQTPYWLILGLKYHRFPSETHAYTHAH